MPIEIEHTLAIIKPLAVKSFHQEAIIKKIKEAGFSIQERIEKTLSLSEAIDFYAVHRGRPFYQELCEYISSGPIVVLKLAKKNAIADFRTLIGATNPQEAKKGTIRQEFGTSIGKNAIHGSDAQETAVKEIAFFFGKD